MSDSEPNIRRSLRARPCKIKEERRKSVKLSCNLEENIEEVYLQTNSKSSEFHHSALETIYEAPKGNNTTHRDCMGVVKLKRHCRFSPFYSPSKFKIKLRKNKSKNFIKRVGVKVPTGLNITLEQVEKALQSISEDENEENEGVIQNMNQENMGISTSTEYWQSEMSEIPNQKESSSLSSNFNIFSVQPDSKFSASIQCSTKELRDKTNGIIEDKLFDEDFDIFSSKYTVDKSKRNRRRSGRVQPLNLTSKPDLLTPLHITPKDDYNVSILSKTTSIHQHLLLNSGCSEPLQLPQEAVCRTQVINEGGVLSNNSIATNVSVANTGNDPHNVSKVAEDRLSPRNEVVSNRRKTKRNMRKVSGINRSLYKTLNTTLSPESPKEQRSSPIKPDCTLESASTSKLLLPLFDQLKIYSPESEKTAKAKKVRRKSARLSSGETHSLLGSMWTQSKSPTTNVNEPFTSVLNLTPLKDSGGTENLMQLEVNLNEIHSKTSQNCKPLISEHNSTAVKQSLKTDRIKQKKHVSNPAFEEDDPPILTGIFDCSARIHKNKGLVTKKGVQMNFKHFKFHSH